MQPDDKGSYWTPQDNAAPAAPASTFPQQPVENVPISPSQPVAPTSTPSIPAPVQPASLPQVNDPQPSTQVVQPEQVPIAYTSPVNPPQASPVPDQPIASGGVLEWQASEYIHHEKQGRWFAGLYGVAFVLLLLSIFVIQSYTFPILIVVMAIVLTVFAVRQPRIMNYRLTPQSIEINGREYSYHDFRYFGIVQDGPLYSAQLVSNRRLVPAVTVYFPPEHGEQIVDMLGTFLPMQHVQLDFIDRLSRQLRF